MPTIKIIDLQGGEHEVEGNVGQSVMQIATDNLVPGIVSECGGSCACASCHAYVDEAWVDHLPAPQALEAELLTCVLAPRPNSRLTCQIKLSDKLSGLVIHAADNGF